MGGLANEKKSSNHPFGMVRNPADGVSDSAVPAGYHQADDGLAFVDKGVCLGVVEMWDIIYGAIMMVLGAAVQHFFFERKPDKYDLPHQEYHELRHYPMGVETFGIACALCKNRPYTDGICGECKCEYMSHWEPDCEKMRKVLGE